MLFKTLKTTARPRFVLRNRLFVPLLLSQLALGWSLLRLYHLQSSERSVIAVAGGYEQVNSRMTNVSDVSGQKNEYVTSQPTTTTSKRIGVSVDNMPANVPSVRAAKSVTLIPLVTSVVIIPAPTATSAVFQVPDTQKRKNDEEVVIDQQ